MIGFLIRAGWTAGILTGFLWRLTSFEFLDSSLEMFTTSSEVLHGLPEGFADSDEFLSGEAFKVWHHGWHVLVRVADQAGLGDRDEQLLQNGFVGGKVTVDLGFSVRNVHCGKEILCGLNIKR